MADMINGNTNIGIAAGGLSEALSPEIMKLADDDPAKAQWLSYVLGYATDRIMGGNGQQGGSISQYATKWNRTHVLGNTKINYSPNNQKLIEQLTLFHARELVKKGKVNIKKMTSIAIGIETEGFGHAGLIIGFDDNTYEEANFGRYGSNVTRISSTPYTSPIGGRTYAFDYNYIPSKDIKRLYFIDVNPNDVAKEYGWKKVGKAADNRDVFQDESGYRYTIDTLHGRFEKWGRDNYHIDEINIDLKPQNKHKPNAKLNWRKK